MNALSDRFSMNRFELTRFQLTRLKGFRKTEIHGDTKLAKCNTRKLYPPTHRAVRYVHYERLGRRMTRVARHCINLIYNTPRTDSVSRCNP